jgi:exopolysaccharide biosynthesis polyprenyl glycosylphosphotransferase
MSSQTTSRARGRLEPTSVVVPVPPAELDPRPEASWQKKMIRTLVVGDFLAGGVAATVALLARFPEGTPHRYELTTALFPFAWVAACAASRAYEGRFLGTGADEFRRLFDAGVRLLALTAVVTFATKLDVARVYAIIAFPAAVALTLLVHWSVRRRLHRARLQGRALHRVIVVGRERSCAELVQQLKTSVTSGFAVVGACVDFSSATSVEGVPIMGASSEVMEALRRTGADTVAVSAWSDVSKADLRRLSWQLEGSGVSLVVAPSIVDVAGPRIHIRPVAGLPLLHVEEPELSGGRRLLKGAADRTVAGVALVLLSPLLVAIMVAIRIDSRGPAFFRQERVGVRGRTFTMLKLRSMSVDAEDRLTSLEPANQSDGLLFKIREDPRITRVGKWLRRYSLDEIPQLINIVRGDMSLVGPRPPLPSEVVRYEQDVHRRMLVKPGLTGLWQISGRSDLSWEESVRLDLNYVENWTLALDAMIVCKTFSAVLGRRGAY